MGGYNVALKLMGYSLYVDKNIDDDDCQINLELCEGNILPVNISHDDNRIRLVNNKERFLYSVKYLYNAIILFFIVWSFIYSIVISVKNKNVDYVGGCVFQLLFSIQYVVGIWLFNHEYFFTKIKKYTNMKKQLSLVLPIAVVFAMLLSIGYCLIIFLNSKINQTSIFQLFRENSSPLLIVVIFIDKFYSYGSFLINVSIFVILMTQHQKEITEYSQHMKTYIASTVSIHDKVRSISMDLLTMNENLDKTIKKLNWFFSTTSILGLVSMFFITRSFVESGVSSLDMFNLILFLMIEYVYVSFAQKTRESINSINSNVTMVVCTNNYMQRDSVEIVVEETVMFDQQKQYQMISQNQIYLAEIAEGIQWMQLQKILELEWGTFEIFGIEIRDTSLIQKIVGILITILIASDLVDIISF